MPAAAGAVAAAAAADQMLGQEEDSHLAIVLVRCITSMKFPGWPFTVKHIISSSICCLFHANSFSSLNFIPSQ